MRIGRKALAFVLVAAALILLFFITQKQLPRWVQEVSNNPETPKLPYFIFRTMLRMVAAYALVLLFGVPYGIIAGLYKKPRKVMLPLLDILQSIPVLGYLPAAILFFINLFPGEVGVEVASILLIFTGEAWAVTFGVYGATRNMPQDLKNISKAFSVSGIRYIRKVILPLIFPALVTGSILAWGGGWYFLVACEFMTFGGKTYTLPGVGYYLAHSVYVQHSLVSASFGLGVFVLIIFLMNKLVWEPLVDYSEKFKVQTLETPGTHKISGAPVVRFVEFLKHRVDDIFERFCELEILQKTGRMVKLPAVKLEPMLPEFRMRMTIRRIGLFSLLFIGVMYFIGLFVAASLQKPLSDLQLSFQTHPDAYSIPLLALYSMLRIFLAYIIALTWTLLAGILITRSKRLSQIFFPLFDVGQSIPALALFPFIIIVVFKYLGTGSLGVETASVLLLLTGTQWYLLFNIISAIKSIPGDVTEAANAFGITDWKFVRHVMLPAILPGIIVGSIQAWGGAWNASIVSEYINYGGHIPFEANYSGVELSQITVRVEDRSSTINCYAGRCSGSLEVAGVGQHNASLELLNTSFPLAFNVHNIGEKAEAGEPNSIPLQVGQIILIAPTNGSSYPLHPYSVDGLGAFLNKATAEWGDPNLVTVAIATMALTIITLNHFVWGYLFTKAERYKFEMT